jgi:hypothetical protein
MAVPPTSNLAAIETKVRRLTRSPSTAQLTQADLENYINTFVIYDFPEQIRTFNLRQTFTFYCNPYQDEYPTDVISFGGVMNNPLYNFQNKYLTVHPPLYIAGYNSFYTQSREQFFGIYPKLNNIASIGVTGDGLVTTFTGVVNSQQAIVPPGLIQKIALLQNQVLFSSVDITGSGLALIDVPVLNVATGNPFPIGNLYIPGQTPALPPTAVLANNNINYATGQFTITFPTAPGDGIAINSQTVPTALSLPQAMLFYENKFTLRPVPDQPYRINFEVYVRPTYLMEEASEPALEEYWQYIAYGAAKKIFEDRMDIESVQMIMPEFKTQERLCLRRTLVQLSNQRTATIYTESVGPGNGWNGWGNGSSGL